MITSKDKVAYRVNYRDVDAPKDEWLYHTDFLAIPAVGDKMFLKGLRREIVNRIFLFDQEPQQIVVELKSPQ